jgi:hypothetical protein
MTLSRRKAIALFGGGTILAATAGMGAFLGTRTAHSALAPWTMAGGYDDPRLNALSFGLLAPNPHNLQPWFIALEGDNAFTLRHDTSRRLPHTDPFDRQITIGLGCFLEQTRIAASADGYDVALDLYPEGPDGPVARATFEKGGSPDPLAAHIMNRRSAKEAFADTPVSNEQADQLRQYCEVHIDQPMVQRLKKITWAAQRLEMHIPRTMHESVEWMRFGKAEINASPDGIALSGPFLETLMLAGILSREAQGDQNSQGFKEGVKTWKQMFAATPAYVSMTTDGNTRKDQIETGARWVRLNLATTALGLSLHPISQAVQEYDEMKPHFKAVHDLLATDGQTVQMLGRLGYGPQTPRAPRWALETKLRDGRS